MENVTKALLIAAAVIVVLVIIGLGMYYLGIGRQAMGNTQEMDAAQITAYNSPFVNYQGAVNGSTARNLVDTVNRHNQSHSDEPNFNVRINDKTGGDPTTAGCADTANSPSTALCTKFETTSIKTTERYQIKLIYAEGDTSGFIVNISLKKI